MTVFAEDYPAFESVFTDHHLNSPDGHLFPSANAMGIAWKLAEPRHEVRFKAEQFNPEEIRTYWFNTATIFEGSEELQREIMENGKNPGLHIREFHERDITGKSVNVAVIGFDIFQDHPEYAGRIMAYYKSPNLPDINDMTGMSDSMKRQEKLWTMLYGYMGISILAGKSMGIAPEANIYYAAVSLYGYYKDAADAIYWIIEQNNQLPQDNKIRIISAPYSMIYEEFQEVLDEYNTAVKAARENGIIVLDCADNEETNIAVSAYLNPEEPENVAQMRLADHEENINTPAYNMLGAPNGSFRTYAEGFTKGDYSYFYSPWGYQALCVPYVAGVLALGFQIVPELSGEEMLDLLIYSAYSNYFNGNRFIYPRAFIRDVREEAKRFAPVRVTYIDNLFFVNIALLAVIITGIAVFVVLKKRKKI